MMASSFFRREPRAFLGDSVVLEAALYNNDNTALVPQAAITGVTFSVMAPLDPVDTPSVDEEAGSITGDGLGQFVVPSSVTTSAGHYRGIAVFSYRDGAITGLTKTVPSNFEIEDAFETTGASPADPYVDQAWMKLEDCFDSDLGGPWLRDMTMNFFDKYKIRELIPEVMLAINQQMPFSDHTEASFPYGAHDGGALFAEGLLVATIRHLMRSYTEQPDIVGSPVAFEMRQRYLQAWQSVYEIEYPTFKEWLVRWKLRAYDLTTAKLLVSSKAGRNLSGPMRTRQVFPGGW